MSTLAAEELPTGSGNRARYLTFEPGVQYSSTLLNIRDSHSEATMFGMPRPTLQIGISTPEHKFFDAIGVYLLWHTSAFRLTKQKQAEVVGAADRGVASGIGNPLSASNSSNFADLGTRMSGTYSYIAPVVYYGFFNDRMRMGLGAGLSRISMHGTFALSDSMQSYLGYQALTRPGRDAASIELLSNYYQQSGLLHSGDSDPVYNYLVTTLGQPGHLEALGYYLIFKGFKPTREDVLLIAASSAQVGMLAGQWQPVESLALVAMSRGYVRARRLSPVVTPFFEVNDIGPLGLIVRAAIAVSPFETGSEYKYVMMSFGLSLTLPIRF